MERVTRNRLRQHVRTINLTMGGEVVKVGRDGSGGYYVSVMGDRWNHNLTPREANAFLDGFDAHDSLKD